MAHRLPEERHLERMCLCDYCTIIENEIITILRNITYENVRLLQADRMLIVLDHIDILRKANNILFQIAVSSDTTNNISKKYIIKMAIPDADTIPNFPYEKFKKEIMFYKTFVPRFTPPIFPTSYIVELHSSAPFPIPILIMKDLTDNDDTNYTQFETKLSKEYLQECMVGLAHFHAKATQLINENADLAVQYSYHEYPDQMTNISDFLNGSLLKSLSNDIQRKITQKLNKVQEQLLVNRNKSVLLHGALTRSKMFHTIAYDFTNIKFIDFETVSLGSPAVDFGHLLFTNLPIEYDVNSLDTFCNDIVMYYTYMFNRLYPTFDKNGVSANLITNLIYSYINLKESEKIEITDHITLMTVLDNLGSLE